MQKLVVISTLLFLTLFVNAQEVKQPYQFPTGNFRSIITDLELNRFLPDSILRSDTSIYLSDGSLVVIRKNRVVTRVQFDPNGIYYKDSLTYSMHGILIKASSILNYTAPYTLKEPIKLNAAYLKEYQYYYSVVCDTNYWPDIFCYTFDYYNQCIRTQIGSSTDTVVFENVSEENWVCKYLYRDADTAEFYTGQIDTIVNKKIKSSLVFYRDHIGKELANYWVYNYSKEGTLESVIDQLADANKAKKARLPNDSKK